MEEIIILTAQKQLSDRILRADEFFEISSKTVTIYSFKPHLSSKFYLDAGVSIIDQGPEDLLILAHGSKFEVETGTAQAYRAGVLLSNRKGTLVAFRVPIQFQSIELAWTWLNFGIDPKNFLDCALSDEYQEI